MPEKTILPGSASSGENSGSSISTDEHILQLFSRNPTSTIPEVAAALRMTERGVEKRIAGLKKSGRLVRTGSTKKGLWKVIVDC